VLEPDGERLNTTLKGDLAGMLSAARDSKRSPDTGDLLVQNKTGCGGSSATESASLLDSSVGPYLLLVSMEMPKWTILVGAMTRALLMITRAS
jgi:hypothetical protein